MLRLLDNQKGFSLIELVVIIVIIGVLSYFVSANLGDAGANLQYETAIKKLLADIKYARNLAMTENQKSRFYVDLSNNRYYLKWEDGNYIQNPIGGGNFIVQFGQDEFSQVQITNSSFSSGWLEFDTAGVPTNSGVALSQDLVVVSLNSAKNIKITQNTGFLIVEDI